MYDFSKVTVPAHFAVCETDKDQRTALQARFAGTNTVDVILCEEGGFRVNVGLPDGCTQLHSAHYDDMQQAVDAADKLYVALAPHFTALFNTLNSITDEGAPV